MILQKCLLVRQNPDGPYRFFYDRIDGFTFEEGYNYELLVKRTPLENVPADADLVVIGNALSRGNPEVEEVLDRKQPYTSLPALLGEQFLRGQTSLVVAGTHGKTTTTGLLAFLLHAAGRDPSFLVVGIPADFGRSWTGWGAEGCSWSRETSTTAPSSTSAPSSCTTGPTWP